MGRIKTQLIKRTSIELLGLHEQEFKDNFEDNKSLVSKYIETPSRKMRNIIAGYITRLKKSGKTI